MPAALGIGGGDGLLSTYPQSYYTILIKLIIYVEINDSLRYDELNWPEQLHYNETRHWCCHSASYGPE